MVAIVFNELIKPKDIVWYATVGLLGMLYDKKNTLAITNTYYN